MAEKTDDAPLWDKLLQRAVGLRVGCTVCGAC